jgi:hypothetical protein
VSAFFLQNAMAVAFVVGVWQIAGAQEERATYACRKGEPETFTVAIRFTIWFKPLVVDGQGQHSDSKAFQLTLQAAPPNYFK